jgi:hypothetical protein
MSGNDSSTRTTSIFASRRLKAAGAALSWPLCVCVAVVLGVVLPSALDYDTAVLVIGVVSAGLILLLERTLPFESRWNVSDGEFATVRVRMRLLFVLL